jgi:hypothetical protein
MKKIAEAQNLQPEDIERMLQEAGIKHALKGNHSFYQTLSDRLYGKQKDKDVTVNITTNENTEAIKSFESLVRDYPVAELYDRCQKNLADLMLLTPDGRGAVNVFAQANGMLEELEKAHIYIARLNGEITALKAAAEARDAAFARELAELKALLKKEAKLEKSLLRMLKKALKN